MGRAWILSAAVFVWLGGASAAYAYLVDYSVQPGAAAEAPPIWPGGSALHRRPGRASLVMVAHPKCPCTRASLAELERVLARSGDRVDATLLFSPLVHGAPNDLLALAERIPGLRIVYDEDGHEGRRFGAATSGQVYLYGADGKLQFAGGITAARGHEGDNDGADALIARLRGEEGRARHAVFGCALVKGDAR